MSKRSFYSDEEDVTSTPGLTTKISQELESKEIVHLDDNTKLVKGKLIKTFPQLEGYSRQARQWLILKADIIGDEYNNLKSALVNELSGVTSKYNELITEPILPSFIYILTASLSGSILVNRRNIGLRFFTPVVFGTVALKYFMPQSYSNLGKWIYQLEGTYVPEVQKFQDDTATSTCELIEASKQFKKDFDNGLVSSVRDTRNLIVEWSSKK